MKVEKPETVRDVRLYFKSLFESTRSPESMQNLISFETFVRIHKLDDMDNVVINYNSVELDIKLYNKTKH